MEGGIFCLLTLWHTGIKWQMNCTYMSTLLVFWALKSHDCSSVFGSFTHWWHTIWGSVSCSRALWHADWRSLSSGLINWLMDDLLYALNTKFLQHNIYRKVKFIFNFSCQFCLLSITQREPQRKNGKKQNHPGGSTHCTLMYERVLAATTRVRLWPVVLCCMLSPLPWFSVCHQVSHQRII